MRQANRIMPQLPAQAFKTYQIVAPVSTHFRPASCAEVDCPNMAHGWRTVIDESTELGQQQAHYIRRQSKRRVTEDRDETGLTVFVFAAGQECFAQHHARLDRPELFLVRGGDWRGDPAGVRPYQHTRSANWVEDFAEHQQRIADQQQKG
jgi:hypothetical protein